ncbi:MAG TPA: HU family DNA-binding protein [Candidatus Anaerobiospirillum pullistercoris]|uniref:HU family DNA-binding protein n=1 Tax=Candidatus Anaerobiospirillum pullistercoris TaxID=2838452 RepID=A0A9D2B0Z7_9GAMM|nr:HU family DNA-binding protein [Candidatus Anaerobiospirillum pullistercoris]
MNKSELVERVSKKANLSVKDSNAAVNAFMSVVKESLANGEEVVLVGFGSFLVRDRAARTGHNPRTGEPLSIPAVKVPAFRPGKTLKDSVNQ